MNPPRPKLFAPTFALFLGLGAISATAWAEPPPVIPIQGILSDAQGTPLDQNASMVFTIYAGNTTIFTEQAVVVVDEGSFTHYVGSVATLDMKIFQNNSDLTLGIKIGSDDELTPRIKLGSVPYAAMATRASDAMTLDGRSPTDFLAASTFLSGLSATAIEGFARGVCYDTPDELHAVLDPRYYRTASELRAVLDSTYVNTGQADSITTAMIQNGAVNRGKLHGTTQLFRVTVSNCTLAAGSLSTSSTCNTDQTDALSCPTCPSGQHKARTCTGSCTCVSGLVNFPAIPAYPTCSNTSIGYAVNQ